MGFCSFFVVCTLFIGRFCIFVLVLFQLRMGALFSALVAVWLGFFILFMFTREYMLFASNV